MIRPTQTDRTDTLPPSKPVPSLGQAFAVSWLLAVAGLAACGGSGATAPSPSAPAATLPAVDVSAVAAADPGSPLPEGWESGATMEIFVRSYQDSDGDGKGDLRGLTSRLDYLRDLGVKAVWLMPVTASLDGDHGYAVSDYRAVEKAYGSLADFDELVRQAHTRGIGVIVDYVMNHSASSHPLFVNARDGGGANAYRDWYVWQASAPAGWSVFGANPWRGTVASGYYYAPFSDTMPDFNLKRPAVVDFHLDNQRFWLNRGVDGFRFDAVGHLVENGPTAWLDQPQNYELMGRMAALARSYQRRTIVCEAPDDPRGFAAGSACGSAFAFDLKASLIGAARGSVPAIQAVADYFKTAPAGMATFLSNHDAFAGQRLWDQLGGNLAQYKLAAASYLLLPGRPFIYYGEEIGMAGAATVGGDPGVRTPMSWTADTKNAGFSTGTPYRVLSANVAAQNVAAQSADPNGLLAFYRQMLALRNDLPSIARGSYLSPFVAGSALGFQRVLGGERTLVLVNYGGSGATLDVAALPANASLQSAYPAGGVAATASADGVARVAVPAQSVRVFKVLPP